MATSTPLVAATWSEPTANMLLWACTNGGGTPYSTGDKLPDVEVCSYARGNDGSKPNDHRVADGSQCHGVGSGFEQVYQLTGGASERAWDSTAPESFPPGFVNNIVDRDDCRGLMGSNRKISGFRCCLRLW